MPTKKKNSAPSNPAELLLPIAPPSPTPFEVAQLAALLDPKACTGTGAKDVLEQAHDLYMASAFYMSDAKRFTPGQLHEQYVVALDRLGFRERLLEASAEGGKLRLYREDRADGDPIKDYLLKHSGAGLRDWKKTRSVLDAIKKYFIDGANDHNTKCAEGIADLEANHRRMAAERGITTRQLRNGMEIPINQLWFDAEENYVDFLVHLQVPGPEFDDSGKMIQSKIEYWEIPMEFLDRVISWRHSLKKRKVDWKGIRPFTREEILGPEQTRTAANIKNPKKRRDSHAE